MIQVSIFLILTIIMVLLLAVLLMKLTHYIIMRFIKKANLKSITNIKKTALFLAVVMTINIGFVTFTQLTAYTPPIDAENGIAEMIELELNDRKQWISIRSWDKNNPVLLFLAGGPGGTQMAAVRHELMELEKYFVVVNWDQPGSGKSYYAEKTHNITVETYIQDGYALTEYLTKRFSKNKIYLIGESWGSALGIFLVSKYPQFYHALIGTGQMIDFAETERMDYAMAMEIAQNNGDAELVEKLTANGEPPYYGKNVTWKSAVYLNYLSMAMTNNPKIHNSGYNTLRDICSPEYGLLDKINYVRGIVNTYNQVYQQLYEIDMRTDYTKLEVPVYFFLGKHDINAPTALVEEYEQILDAPDKKIVWFEHSGHNPWINERDKFVREVLSCFLAN